MDQCNTFDRRFLFGFTLAFGLTLVSIQPARGDEPTEAEILFATAVKPLLVSKCFACHGDDPENIKGGLNLTTREGMLEGGDIQGPAIEPSEAEFSPLYYTVKRTEPGFEMPPKESDKLTEEQTWQIRDWINAGAPWPDEPTIEAIRATYAEGVVVSTSGGLSEDWTNRRYRREDLWAYRRIQRPAVPSLDQMGVNPIDAFVNRRLRELGLEPGPRADRTTLIRRASFDLLGLPPAPAEVDRFFNDPRPDAIAFGELLDRLLASPAYGERWGRHWLDVTRYADTAGFANDYERPNAWRYRDYVVRALNEDRPYDRFVAEQLAGDEIAPDDTEALIGVGFLRMGPWEQTGMSVAKVTRQQFLDDVTDAVGQVFLAHPLQCARCHDHKFDPIPTQDYYSIQSVFATTQFADRDAKFLPSENTSAGFDERPYLQERLKRYQALLKSIRNKEQVAERAWYANRGLEYDTRGKKERQGVPSDEIAPLRIGLTPEDLGLDRIARKYITRHSWELDRYRPIAYSVYSGGTRLQQNISGRIQAPHNILKTGILEETAILTGGDLFSPSTPVSPAPLSCVPLREDGTEARPIVEIPETPTGRRQAFAAWMTDPENPLPARVMVNRVWQWHFGRGLVRTANNFGTMGSKPTHPQLLDWLASEFIERGWSIKDLHRLIMMSDAYSRSTVHPDPELLRRLDPKGESLARFRPRRLSVEELRDAMLAASHELNRVIGGVPVRPDINQEVALQPRMIMGTYAPAYQPSPDPAQRHRRTLYAITIRGQRDPFLTVFNQPSPDESCAGRPSSTVAPQALTLLNSQESYDRALAMAVDLIDHGSDRSQAVRDAFKRTTGAEPSAEDLDDLLAHWEAMTARHAEFTLSLRAIPTEVTRRAVEEISGETFEFTEELELNGMYVTNVKPEVLPPEVRGLADLCLVLFNSNPFLYVD